MAFRCLNKAINRLRETLGDSADAPRFIETLPKRGYRFIGTIDRPKTSVAAALEAKPTDANRIEAAPRRTRVVLAWATAAAAALIAIASAWWLTSNRPAQTEGGPLVRSSLLPPQDRALVPYSLALSRDGTHLAFVAEAADGSRSLWIRAMSATTATPIAGTDGASFPFWSPDLRHVGFFASRKLKVVEVAGGAVRIIADAPRASGGTWNSGDVIVFAPDVNGPLYRVPAGGGTPVAVSRVPDGDGMHGHRWPVFLPDGRLFLYVAFSAVAPSDNAPELHIGSLDMLESSRIEWNGARSVAYALDHLVYVRGGMLYAQPFDSSARRTSGPPVAVGGAELAVAPAFYPSALAASANGVLIFQARVTSSRS